MATPKIAKITTMEMTGLDELRETLTDVAPREANNILRATVHGIAGLVRDAMKARVTKLTGALAQSIKAVRRRSPAPNVHVSDVRVGGTAPYGLMLEWGTSKTKAQPYIVPTVEQVRPTMPRLYKEEFGEKFEKAMARRKKNKK